MAHLRSNKPKLPIGVQLLICQLGEAKAVFPNGKCNQSNSGKLCVQPTEDQTEVTAVEAVTEGVVVVTSQHPNSMMTE